MKARAALLSLLLLAFLAACTTTPEPAPEPTRPPVDLSLPPAIDFATDMTYPEGRLVTDPRFAAVLITATGETRLFDDIGRMVIQRAAADQPIVAVWVRDYETADWLPGETALFVGSPNLVTPRGSGLLAVGSAERAQQLARELSGQVLAVTELPTYTTAGPALSPPPSGGGLQLGGLLEAEQ